MRGESRDGDFDETAAVACRSAVVQYPFPTCRDISRQAVHLTVGPDGTAQIALAGGKKMTVPKERAQVGISEPQTAPDGRTMGWLVDYDDGVGYPVPGMLVVWRASKVIGRFRTGQSFYSWTFYSGGKQVAYHVGPLHGEQNSHCELHDVETGKLIAAWEGDLDSGDQRPAWTKGLNH
jgi:hypothetical protein